MSHHSHIPPEVDNAVRAFIRRHKRGLRWGCLVAALLMFAAFLAAIWGLWRGAVHVKEWAAGKSPSISLPLEWERPLGEAALAQMRVQYRFINDPQVLESINQLAAPLLAITNNSIGKFSIYVTESKEINAMALPGGFIVLHRGLLEQARSAEETQGVLAHEMAHIIKRHGTLQLAQNLGMDILIQQLQGNENRLLDALIRDSGQLLGFKFSRDHERVADDVGWDLLEQARLNPQGMVAFFVALKAEQDSKGPGSPVTGASLLSTHPTSQERIDRLNQKQIKTREFTSYEKDYQKLRERLNSMFDGS